MAVSKVLAGQRDALVAGADLSDWLYKFCSLNSAGNVVKTAVAQDTNIAGVVYETGDVGDHVTFAMAGTGAIAKVVCGVALAVNDKVAPNADGVAIIATTKGVGLVRKGTTAAGQIAEIYLRPVVA